MQTSLQPRPATPENRMPVGIQTLADELNLSIATVSRAMKDDAKIRYETRQRVQEAARKLGYIPNHQARLLRAGKTRRLGLVLPSLINPVYSEKIATSQSIARELGYELTFACAERNPSQEDMQIRHLISLGVDGLIVMLSSQVKDESHAVHLALQRGIAVVLMGNAARVAPPGCSTLRVDSVTGRSRALEYLISLGHRHIGFIGLRQQYDRCFTQLPEDETNVWLPVTRMLKQAGITAGQCQYVSAAPGLASSGYEAMVERLKDTRPLPTAYLAVDDQVAIGAMTALQNHGLRVPHDISMVGADNTVTAKFAQPCLTTISQTHLDLGKRAIEMVVRHIQTPDLPAEHTLLDTTLIVGLSTARAREHQLPAEL